MALGLVTPSKIVPGTVQGWVPTLIVETKPFLQGLRDQGVNAVDVETRYFAEFFNEHKATEQSLILVASDQPLGKMTYDQQNATRFYPMNTIKKMVPHIMNYSMLSRKKTDFAAAHRKVPDFSAGPLPASVPGVTHDFYPREDELPPRGR